MNEFGPLADLVAIAGCIMAAGTALLAAWTGKRTKWAPVQEQLPNGARRVAGLLSAATTAILYIEWATGIARAAGILTIIVVLALVLTALAFYFYQHQLGLLTYRIHKGTPAETQIVGGSELTARARKAAEAREIEDPEDLLPGFAHDPVQVFTRKSIQQAKSQLSALYAVFLYAGTVALAAVALRLSIAI